MTDEELLPGFESLGDNCEFGLVQRSAGVERVGFFRFNFAPLSSLLRALDTGFADVDAPENFEIFIERNNELMVRIRAYQFQYHTHVDRGSIELEKLRAQQLKVIRFLADKFLADLRAAQMIFVRKGHDSLTLSEMQRLLDALHRHGPVTLLWVVPQDDAHPAGLVEVIGPQLLRGFVDRFAPYDDAKDWSPSWFSVCRAAHLLCKSGGPPGTSLQCESPVPLPNLIRGAASFSGSGWWYPPHAGWKFTTEIPRHGPNAAIIKHILLQATTYETGCIYGYNSSNGVASGTVYSASAWVWLPDDFAGSEVGAVFNGFPSIKMVNAHIGRRNTWQRVWVSARIPTGVANANPSLNVLAPTGTTLFSTMWRLEMGVHPSESLRALAAET